MTYDILLDIAHASSARAAKWRNKRIYWSALALQLSETERTEETIKQYFAYSKDKQDAIKDVGGYVGGVLMGGPGVMKVNGKAAEVDLKPPFGWRRKGYVESRQIVALDVDFGSVDTWVDFRLLNCAGLFYTTHKHTPESPRLRIVFPLDRPVTPDEYEAIARIVASWLDIEVFDDTTYQPTRLMYFPSTSKDGEYLYDFADAPVLNADETLACLPDWTDPTTWPMSSRELKMKDAATHVGDTVADPETKTGIVGAFCRSYNMEEAILEFLSDVYEPVEAMPDRYSYLGGSTSGGLIVYDNKLAYSHHNSDPAGGKTSNAFDLVRLHKFGELDYKAKEDTEGEKLPSFRAMSEFASQLAPVKRELVRSRRETSAEAYDTFEENARAVGASDEWVAELETEGKKGTIKNTINNVVLILANDINLAGCFGFNEFEVREVAIKALPWDKHGQRYPRPLADSDDAELRLYLERCYGVTGKGAIEDGTVVITKANSFHPVRDYLDAITWDGVPRLDTFFIDILGAKDTPYTRAVTRKAFTASIARIYRPGNKFDYVTVLVGEQGVGKSTCLNFIGGDWFSDSVTTLVGTQAIESIQGSWIIELGELAGLRKAEVEAVKHFVSKKEDRYRVAYGKRVEHFPRRCVFFATTNEDDFLRDVTGNRRFWVINCKGGAPKMDFKKDLTPIYRAQLLAEAKEYYAQNETLYLPDNLEEDARVIQDQHLEKDDRNGLISEYLKKLLPEDWLDLDPYQRRMWLQDDAKNVGTMARTSVSLIEIWTECLSKSPADIQPRDSFALGRVMKTMKGWMPSKAVRIPFYGQQKQYVKK